MHDRFRHAQDSGSLIAGLGVLPNLDKSFRGTVVDLSLHSLLVQQDVSSYTGSWLMRFKMKQGRSCPALPYFPFVCLPSSIDGLPVDLASHSTLTSREQFEQVGW